MQADAQRSFLGHPRALSTLFFTEMWERFSYYGMRALLVLFLVGAVTSGGYGFDDRTATAIYGLYTASVYVSGVPGGWVADRLIGAQAAVLWGAVLIAAGHLLLALPGGHALFYLGLAVIVLGTGLLKPNISALVAVLYPEGGSRREAGFTIFYMAVNIGALTGPLITGWLALAFGWHVAFLAPAAGMGLGVIYFLRTRGRLGSAGLAAQARVDGRDGAQRDWLLFAAGLAVIFALTVCVWTGVIDTSAAALQSGAIYVILALAVGYFLHLLVVADLAASERKRVVVMILLFIASTVFWSGFEQAGSSLNLFASRYTDRVLGSLEIPATWFQSLNSMFVILFAPIFSALWLWLDRRGRDLSPILKFALGLLGMGLGFLVMAAASRVVAGGSLAGPQWLVFTYLFHTWGELALSPVGMSATTQLTPQRFIGQSMGVWFASLSLGNLLASRIAGEFDANNLAAMPGQYMHIFWYGAVAALILLVLSPLARRLSVSQ